MRIEPVTLEVDGVNIVGQLYLPAGDMPYPTVCACHGIPAGIPDPNDRGYASLAEKVGSNGFAVLIFNFRGAGASGGNLDMLGWTRDLKAAIDCLYTLPEVDTSRFSLLGFSGGAVVSVYVAAKDKRISSVVACACPAEFDFFTRGDNPQSLIDHYREIGAIRDNDFPPSPREWLDGFKLVKPIDYIARISPRPLLLVHGSRDDTVSVDDARRLYAQAGEPKKLVIIEGAGHRLRRDEQAMTRVLDWLKSQQEN
ncbi:MAG: alpha/beta fold hydrolase [Dehalococcoidales bacterium]|jgi:dipeptidyl aminopeptidase/acylaminoacyl peptidase|nr:alpha/beta fold hydrolase [Dehalococcoidales bacterium]